MLGGLHSETAMRGLSRPAELGGDTTSSAIVIVNFAEMLNSVINFTGFCASFRV
jgi:hypothetical protein